jgi:hypothetical protein
MTMNKPPQAIDIECIAITGYAAKEAGIGRCSSCVHVFINSRGLCGYKPTGKMRVQWCAYGVVFSYLECDKCKEKVREVYRKKTIESR